MCVCVCVCVYIYIYILSLLIIKKKTLTFPFLFDSVVRWNSNADSTANSFFFFGNYNNVESSYQDVDICLYLKFPPNFMCLILQNRFLFVPVPFGSMVKFKFLAQFPVDHLSHPVMSSLIPALC